ncbi:MAG: DNA-binding response regulator [Oscillospiraceae bacterium]|jgi:two-component system response regulator YesN|nr:DNA-binding response regulator [Oscillospiraceae bacterium]
MLQVVIADDEVRVCRLVQMLVDWNALGMELAGMASNGLEALELVEQAKPDILITDIRMPGCDGLELIERARQISPELEIVIISGYAQFEYAQSAIRYGVGDYLLKPIKQEALNTTLKKLAERCQSRAASFVAMEDLRQSSQKDHDRLRGRLMEDLLQGRLEAPTVEQLKNEYGFPVGTGLFQVYILKIDYIPGTIENASLLALQSKVAQVLEPALKSFYNVGLLQFYRSTGYGVLHFEPYQKSAIRRVLRDCLNQLVAQQLFYGSVEFSLAIGKAVQSSLELPQSLRSARLAICGRLVEGTGRLLESAPSPSPLRMRQVLDKYSHGMERAVDALSADEADRVVEDLRRAAVQVPDARGYELLELVLAAGRMFAVRLHLNDQSDPVKDFAEHCELCGSAERLFDCLRCFQRRQLELLWEQQENEAIRPIRIAKQYIQQHYNEPISLEDVCAATGFSVSYFSTMFKKENGEGFSKYLAWIRIEQAKTLLQDTGLSIAEVCDRVGYNDLKHFTSTFKKITSLNPGQYRKLYG